MIITSGCQYWSSKCTAPVWAQARFGGCDQCHRIWDVNLCERHARETRLVCPCEEGITFMEQSHASYKLQDDGYRLVPEGYKAARERFERTGLIADKERMVAAVTLPKGWTIEQGWSDILKPEAPVATLEDQGFRRRSDGSFEWVGPVSRNLFVRHPWLIAVLMVAVMMLVLAAFAMDGII